MKKRAKRIISMILIVTMLCSLSLGCFVGCGKKEVAVDTVSEEDLEKADVIGEIEIEGTEESEESSSSDVQRLFELIDITDADLVAKLGDASNVNTTTYPGSDIVENAYTYPINDCYFGVGGSLDVIASGGYTWYVSWSAPDSDPLASEIIKQVEESGLALSAREETSFDGQYEAMWLSSSDGIALIKVTRMGGDITLAASSFSEY